MESLQEIMMDAYREGREDEVKEALNRRVELRKSGGKGAKSKVEAHNAKFGDVEGEAAAALKMSRSKDREHVKDDFVGGPEAPEPAQSVPDAFSVFRAMKNLLMKKNQAYHY